MNDKITIFEKIFKISRELLLNILIIMSIYYVYIIASQLKKQFETSNSNIYEISSKVSSNGHNISLEILTKLQNKIEKESLSTTSEEAKNISEKTKNILIAIDEIKNIDINSEKADNFFWVYIGVYKDSRWISNDFGLKNSTQIVQGSILTSALDTYKRDNHPILKGDNWLKGRPLGMIHKGEKIILQEVHQIQGIQDTKLIWAKASILQ